ncbi:MAG: glutathione S-transferase family protein [Kangiellaceae bacterium]|nr:glutathione S-transferase family protein [Kangiellaceae bacterium]
MYQLHHNPYSQHCRRIISLLEEAKLEYKTIPVNLGEGEHMSPEFLAINPNHQVPSFSDNELKLHESHAIMRYLCDKNNLDNWYPKNLELRAQTDQWLEWIQCRMSGAVVNIVLNTVFMGDNGDQAAIIRGHEMMAELSVILEAQLQDNNYIAGDNITIADLALVSNVFQLSMAKAIPEDKPALRTWYDKMMSLPGVRASLPEM